MKPFIIPNADDKEELIRKYFDVLDQIKNLEAVKDTLRPMVFEALNINEKEFGEPVIVEYKGIKCVVRTQSVSNVDLKKIRLHHRLLYMILKPFIKTTTFHVLRVVETEADIGIDPSDLLHNS
jgi:hypothetical protein